MSDQDKGQRLGRGLSALLGESTPEATVPERLGVAREVPIDQLLPNPFQPRQRVNEAEIEALAGSIRENGILQPILVRRSPDKEDAFEIVAGERRWRAAQRAGLHQMPVLIRELTHRTALEFALVENIQREDLTPLEEATGFRRLIENFGHTQDKLARVVGRSRSHVANMMRLLDLPDSIREMLDDGRLTVGHARPLLTASQPEKLAKQIVARDLNVRQAERLARRAATGQAGAARKASAAKDADTRALEDNLVSALGLKVDISHRKDGGGTVRLAYQNVEQLDDIVSRLGRTPERPEP